jgi:hypothetical protein
MSEQLLRRFATYVIVGLVAWFLFYTYTALTAPGKIDEALVQEMGQKARINVVIELGFKPEQLHIKIFQEFGAVVGVDKNKVTLLRVDTNDVRKLARYYWVDRIRGIQRAVGT